MDSTILALRTGAPGHDHLVEFYETEAFLVDTVSAFLVPALRDGDAAIVVATAAHRHKFENAIRGAGIDLDAAAGEGRYLAFDAAVVLSRFMVAGAPDAARFRATVGEVMDRAAEGGRQVRVYGEMVALLWDDGDANSALALEDLWNDLAGIRTFLLLCAYPMRAFGDEASAVAFKRICDQHTRVIPSESYSLIADPAERSRAVAQLQQQAAALHPEVLRMRAQEERDHEGDQRDQAGVKRDHEGDQRDLAGVKRDLAGVKRDRGGDERDLAGVQRDQAADRRDQAADERDQAAELNEASPEAGITTDSLVRSARARREAASDRRRASQDRRAGASERDEAVLDRDTALADRGAGASERTEAELDRDTALANRGASAREREYSSHDYLTGAYRRGAGFVELEREMARTRQSGQPLALAFIDVDGLKAVNDSLGHAAGDRMLREVASTFKARLRSHDLIIRYGGDEFVCVIPGLNMADATARVALVAAALADAPEHGTVTVGLAELLPDDSRDQFVARADAALYRQRQQRRSARV